METKKDKKQQLSDEEPQIRSRTFFKENVYKVREKREEYGKR